MNLSQKIKKARVSAGMSQRELATVLELSDKSISAYEVGRAEPGLEILKKISQVTKTPFNYFIDEMPETDMKLQRKLEIIEKELKEVKELLSKR